MVKLVMVYYCFTNIMFKISPSDLLALHVPNLSPLLPSLATLKIEKNITQFHGLELHFPIKTHFCIWIS